MHITYLLHIKNRTLTGASSYRCFDCWMSGADASLAYPTSTAGSNQNQPTNSQARALAAPSSPRVVPARRSSNVAMPFNDRLPTQTAPLFDRRMQLLFCIFLSYWKTCYCVHVRWTPAIKCNDFHEDKDLYYMTSSLWQWQRITRCSFVSSHFLMELCQFAIVFVTNSKLIIEWTFAVLQHRSCVPSIDYELFSHFQSGSSHAHVTLARNSNI